MFFLCFIESKQCNILLFITLFPVSPQKTADGSARVPALHDKKEELHPRQVLRISQALFHDKHITVIQMFPLGFRLVVSGITVLDGVR